MILFFPKKQIEITTALFDLDGTLVHTNIDFPECSRAMISLASQYRINTTPVLGRDSMAIVYSFMELIEMRDGTPAATKFRAECFRILEKIESKPCENARIFPGVIQFLNTLRRNDVKIGIVTRNSTRAAREIVQRFEIPFDTLIGRDDVVRTKPNPEHLWRALDQLNANAKDSIMVGDHWMDVQSGQAAGCAATVGILGNHGPSWFVKNQPDLSVKSVKEIECITVKTEDKTE